MRVAFSGSVVIVFVHLMCAGQDIYTPNSVEATIFTSTASMTMAVTTPPEPGVIIFMVVPHMLTSVFVPVRNNILAIKAAYSDKIFRSKLCWLIIVPI